MAKRKFKPGDKVKIVNNKGVEKWFAVGDEYTIESITDDGRIAGFIETQYVALTKRLKLLKPS